jgi:hypothetical protein
MGVIPSLVTGLKEMIKNKKEDDGMNVVDEIEMELAKLRNKKDNIRYLRQICALEYMKEQFRILTRLDKEEEETKITDFIK